MTPDKRNLLRGRGLVVSRLVFRIQIDKQDVVCNGRWVARRYGTAGCRMSRTTSLAEPGIVINFKQHTARFSLSRTPPHLAPPRVCRHAHLTNAPSPPPDQRLSIPFALPSFRSSQSALERFSTFRRFGSNANSISTQYSNLFLSFVAAKINASLSSKPRELSVNNNFRKISSNRITLENSPRCCSVP